MSFVDDLVKFQAENPKLISCRSSDDGRFRVFKYTAQTQFGHKFNLYSKECRGLTLDSKNNIVSYPFSKFFNYGREKECDKFDINETVYAIRKINGFLSIVSVYNGELIVHTAGSFSKKYSDMINYFIDKEKWLSILDSNKTYMFECVSNETMNDHVIEEKEGLTLLGWRENFIGSEIHYKVDELQNLANRLNCHVSDGKYIVLKQLLNEVDDVPFEGYVFYSLDGKRVCKLKGANFLFKRLLANMKGDNLAKLNSFNKNDFDEEYNDLFNYVNDHIDTWLSMDKPTRVNFIREMLKVN